MRGCHVRLLPREDAIGLVSLPMTGKGRGGSRTAHGRLERVGEGSGEREGTNLCSYSADGREVCEAAQRPPLFRGR